MSSKGFSIADFTSKFFTRKNKCFNYIATAFELSLESLLLLAVTMGCSAMVLSLVNMCWLSYRDTHVGFVFIEQLGNNYEFFTELLDQDILSISFLLTISTFILCLAISTVCQFVYLGRYFQGISGWLHKFMYWGIPLTFIVSAYFYRWPVYAVDHWSAAYILYVAPTLCIYGLCFKITNKLFPEIGSAIRVSIKAMGFIADHVRSDDKGVPAPAVESKAPDTPPQAEPATTMKANTTN